MQGAANALDYTIGGVPVSRGALRRGVLLTGGIGHRSLSIVQDLIRQALVHGASVVVRDVQGEHAERCYIEWRDRLMDWDDGPVEAADWVLATPTIAGGRVLFALDAEIVEGALDAVARLPFSVQRAGLWVVLDGFDGSQTNKEVMLLRSALARWHPSVVIVTVASGGCTPEMGMALNQHGTLVVLSGAPLPEPDAATA